MHTYIWDGDLNSGNIFDVGDLLPAMSIDDGEAAALCGIFPSVDQAGWEEEKEDKVPATLLSSAEALLQPTIPLLQLLATTAKNTTGSATATGCGSSAANPFHQGLPAPGAPHQYPPPSDTGTSLHLPSSGICGPRKSFSARTLLAQQGQLPPQQRQRHSERTGIPVSPLAVAAAAAASTTGAFDPGLQLMCQHMLAWQEVKKHKQQQGNVATAGALLPSRSPCEDLLGQLAFHGSSVAGHKRRGASDTRGLWTAPRGASESCLRH